MNKRILIVSGALALTLLASGAQAEGLSFGNVFGGNGASADRSQITAPGHNRYAPQSGAQASQAGKVYASGFYSSSARAQAVHSRYDN